MLDGYSWLGAPQPNLKPFALLAAGRRKLTSLFSRQSLTIVHSDVRELFGGPSRGVFVSTGDAVLLTSASFRYDAKANASVAVPLVATGVAASVSAGATANYAFFYKFSELWRDSVVDRVSFNVRLLAGVSDKIGKSNYDLIKTGRSFVVTDVVYCREFEVRKLSATSFEAGVGTEAMVQHKISASLEASAELELRYSKRQKTAVAIKVCKLNYDLAQGVLRLGDESIQTLRGSDHSTTDTGSDDIGTVVWLEQ